MNKNKYRETLAKLDAAIAARINNAPRRINYKTAKLRMVWLTAKRRIHGFIKMLQR